jgi:MFS family permease
MRLRDLAQLTSTQWRIVLAAWLGWGFDVFDALLVNFVAPHAIPTLLGLPIGSAAARAATAQWTGILTALLLVGWAVGGLWVGHLADRWGRRRALLLAITVYALGTGASALAPNLTVLVLCRLVASIGLGGEFATGSTLIAESVPGHLRLPAAAFLQTASPLGLFLATLVTWLVAGVFMPGDPEHSWRYVLATGVIPILIVLLLRRGHFGDERAPSRRSLPSALARLFAPELRAATGSAVAMAAIGLITWWSCNAFLPSIGFGLGQAAAHARGLTGPDAVRLAESFKASIGVWFNWGGLFGALLTVPIAERLGRRGLFALYFGVGALSILLAFAPHWSAETTLRLTFIIGLAIYGIFAGFAFYLPELFPADVRGVGAGFSYNIGRLLAAAGPFIVGAYSAHQTDPTAGAMHALVVLAALPLGAVLLTPFIVETRGRCLDVDADTPRP